MGGLGEDWNRYEKLRSQQHQEENGSGPENPPPSGNPAKPKRPRQRPTVELGRRPPPPAAGSSATTVRFSPEEALEIDEWLLALRKETGQKLDKGEVIRELLRLARYHPETRRTLVRRLGRGAPPPTRG